jgi:hypothetical protein
VTKIYYLQLLRSSEGTLSCWSRLYLQSLAPTIPHWARVVGYGPVSLCVIHACAPAVRILIGVILFYDYTLIGKTIDLVLIDQQSVGKRSLHLMDTVNAKKRWTTKWSSKYWRVNKFVKESHIVTRLAKDQASFLKTNDINVISFLGRLTVIIVVL